MKVIEKMADTIRNGMRNFLRIAPAQQNMIMIHETLNYENNAAVNRIWYRGDGDELSQLYKSIPGDHTRFWAAVPSYGMDIRKIHTGLPGCIVDILVSIVLSDMNDIKLDDGKEAIWKEIAEQNRFEELMNEALTDVLVVGDGAFRICYDTGVSTMPFIEFVSGEYVEYTVIRGRVKEVIFRTPLRHNHANYTLVEKYGYGYIESHLFMEQSEIDLHALPETKELPPIVTFEDSFMMAVPFRIFKSSKYQGRGKSIYDRKTDAFDSLDEAWSHWMDALRRGRSKEYIPSDMIPRNPNTGEPMLPNAFDHAYVGHDSPMTEGQQKKIELIQPAIPHESYLSTYITALDLCLQGIISPSTLGIDTKKLDNAEAQREKEKATLYTRNKIVRSIQDRIPVLIDAVFKAYAVYLEQPVENVQAVITFGEYANPSFESQVETVSKARQGGIMSIEASVEELYGDTMEESWKAEEIARLKAEQGIMAVEEPAVNADEGIEAMLNEIRDVY